MMELNKVYNIDCIEGMRQLSNGTIDCCITSPPYYGLRDYGAEGQIGLEDTLENYIAKMVEVFREVKRVLRDDGTLWLNLGDSYAGSGKGRNSDQEYHSKNKWKMQDNHTGAISGKLPIHTVPAELKPKDLMGIPWRVAFALQNDGWYLRQDIIWHKPNCMPESVTDRCTKAHEYIFLFSKNAKYYFDNEAVKEKCVNGDPNPPRGSVAVLGNRHKGNRKTFRGGGAYTEGQSFNNSVKSPAVTKGNKPNKLGKRNKRSVWTVSTAQNSVAHFATFPEELIKPCILAGCPAEGIVMDPFMGSGTTGKVAQDLGRQFIGFELNSEYCDMANDRTAQLRIEFETNAARA